MSKQTKLLSFLTIIAICSCAPQQMAPMSNKNAKNAGAGAGAVGGAILGSIIGHQSGNAGKGAAIGAVAGVLSGYQNGPKWFGGDGSIQQTKRGDQQTNSQQ